ncbi:MAG: MFS transporter [Solirubrobacteraceae bacterium]
MAEPLYLVQAVVVLDGAMVAIALPKLQDGLSLSVVQLQWVVNATLIAWAALLIPAGRRADRIGHRRSVCHGLVVLAVGSLCSALAPSFAVLMVGRVAQGIGAALTVPSVLALLAQAAPRRERGQALGRFAALLGVLELLGPVYGGLLVVSLGWRAVFISALAFSLGALALVRLRVPESPGSAPPAIDWAGSVLLAAIVVALVLGTIEVHSSGIGSLPALALYASAVVAGGAVVVAERRSSAPTLDLGLLRSADFSATLAVLFAVSFALGAYFFFMTIYLQRALHMSALLAGVGLIPTSLFTIFLSARIGRIGDRRSHYALVIAGLLPLIGGLLLTILGTSALTYAAVLPALVAVGVGIALFRTPLLSLIHHPLAGHQAGMGTATGELMGLLGGAMGIAVGVTVFLAVSTADLNARFLTAGIEHHFTPSELRLPAAGIEQHFTPSELRSLWENPAPAEEKYHALPAPVRHEVRKVIVDTANDALASALYVCAALVGAVGLVMAGLVARRSWNRRRTRAATSG